MGIMAKQTTNTLLMVEPVSFGFNDQTAANNYFQQKDGLSNRDIQKLALAEFNEMVEKLRGKGINIIVIQDTVEPHTPDSIFPNNWISLHAGGRIALYPMYAPNRRAERRKDIFQILSDKGYPISEIADYTSHENYNRFLEGTGSIIFDHIYKIAYAAISERTDKDLFCKVCSDFGYLPVYFTANQSVNGKRLPIYHTNVMMCVADTYAVICTQSIDNSAERNTVIESVTNSGKEIIEISEEQMHHFAGNMLQVENNAGTRYLVMSQSAFDSLSHLQKEQLTSMNEIITVAIPTIEKYGGGSARCMIAEVFS